MYFVVGKNADQLHGVVTRSASLFSQMQKAGFFMTWLMSNQRTNGPVNAHLISGPTVRTKTSFPKFDVVLIWVKVNSGSSFI